MNREGKWRWRGQLAALAGILLVLHGCGKPSGPPVGEIQDPPATMVSKSPEGASIASASDSVSTTTGATNATDLQSSESSDVESMSGKTPATKDDSPADESAIEPVASDDSASVVQDDGSATEMLPVSPTNEASGTGEGATSDTTWTQPETSAPDNSGPANQAASDHEDNAVSSPAKDKALFEEPLFEGWPTPAAAILITGRQYGYLEPCGCAGLANQKGGLVRRYVLLKQLREKNWPVVPIDAGNQIRRFGRQAEIKFQFTIEGLRMMGYRAIAFGPDDLRLPAPELIAVVAGEGDLPSEFVSANAVVLDQSFTARYHVVEAGGKKIGITSVLGPRNAKMINNDEVILSSAEEGLDQVWPEMKAQNCDLYVLIAHATMSESIELGKKYPQFPIVITTGGAGEPAMQPEKIEGTQSLLIQAGDKGMFAGLVGLFNDARVPLRYQRIPLDGRFPDSSEMLRLLAAYQDQLKEAGWDGLGITTQPHPSGRQFVGSESCAECHPNDFDVWKDGLDGKGGPHWHATETLVHPGERSEVPRHFDPECISCHVVGWNPQKHFPYESGYVGLDKTPDKLNVGCENCHGPGSAHVAAESGNVDATDDELTKLQEELRLPLERARDKCVECHDLDNSPAFQEEGAFERYWEKIKH